MTTDALPPTTPLIEPPDVTDAVETRAGVLRAAIVLISEHGIDGMTMRQVAQAAGLSTGTINYHFTNKRGLILAVLDAAPPTPVDATAPDALARLRGILHGFVLGDDERRAWWRFWVEVTAQAARDSDFCGRQRSRILAQRQTVTDLIAQGIADGQLRADLDPERVAEPLIALAYGLALQQLALPEPETVQRASDALEGSIRELAVR